MTCHEHEWRWIESQDWREIWQRHTKPGPDPEQPNVEIIWSPVNAICNKCGETTWAHGIFPGRSKPFEY